MNILIIDLINGYGGAEKYIAQVCQYIKSLGHYPKVIVSNKIFLEELQHQGIDAELIDCPPLKKNLWRYPWYIKRTFIDILKAIRGIKYDVILNNSERGLIFLGKLRHQWHKIKIIHVCHTTQKSLVLENISARHIDKVICVSEHLRKRLSSKIQSKAIVIPNGFYLHEAMLDLRPSSKTGLVVGLACVVSPLKSIETALQALRILTERGKSVHLKMALIFQYSGKYGLYIRALIDKMRKYYHIDIFEDVINIHDFFLSCHIALLTSISKYGGPETFGRTIVEGWDAGCAVISSDCGGPRELIRDGINGLLYNEGNANVLADKIQLLYDDDIVLNNICRQGKIESSMFSMDIVGNKILDVLQSNI